MMKKKDKADSGILFSELENAVKEKALEIEAELNDHDIPEGSTRRDEAIRRAQQWFLEMEG